MSTKSHSERLARALESTGLVQPVHDTYAENRINVLCRVMPEHEKRWTELVRLLLIAEQNEAGEVHGWKSHICRHYFLKEVDGDHRLVWGWNVSIHSLHMSSSLDALMPVIKGQPLNTKVVSRELTEFPLGGSPDRNTPKTPGGKGVHLIGEREFHPARK
jgi:hypothetical protein